MRRLFHVATEDLWSARLARPPAERGPFAPPRLPTEGFVHLSFAHQLAGTLDAHFTQHTRVYLVEVDPSAFGEDLRLEVSRGGAAFPHLYRALRAHELLRAWLVPRETHWRVPQLSATDAAQDIPMGRSDLV